MHRTKVKYENKERAITKKANKSHGSCALHSPLMRSIHPQNFITLASIVLEICSGQKSSMKINKGQLLKKKANKSYGSCALHSPLMRYIYPQNFITIASIVLEICFGQNSSMKINKGQ